MSIENESAMQTRLSGPAELLSRASPRGTGQSRSGIALVIVLGFLTLLTILAVSFAISMRTERLSSSLHVHATQARNLTHVAVARAMQAVENDLAWKWNGSDRYTDTPMAPTWLVLASTGTGTQVSLATGIATNYLPAVAFKPYTTGTNTCPTVSQRVPVWDDIVVDGQIIGRYAYTVVDCSGLLDITAVNQQARSYTYSAGVANVAGEPMVCSDPRGIQLFFPLTTEFSNTLKVNTYMAELSNNWGRVESMAELRQLLQNAGCKQPDQSFYYSYAPNHEWYDTYNQVVRPRCVLGTNETSFRANKPAILAAITELNHDTDQRAGQSWNASRPYIDQQQDTWTYVTPEMAYDAILNYIDKDFNLTKDAAAYPSSQAYNSILNEPVPMINEIIFTNRISGGTNFPSGSTWTNTLTVFVEVANLNGVKNPRDYDLEIQITSTPSSRDLKLATAGFVKIDMNGPWLENEYRVLNNQVTLTGTFSYPASMTVRPCTYNITARIKDMSGADPGYPAGTIVDQVTGLALLATDAIQAGAVSQLTAPMDMASTVSKTPKMARSGFLSNWTDAQYVLRTVTAFPAYLANWDPVITPGFYNREGFLSGGDTNGVTTWLMHSRSQNRLDSVGELHRVILDTRQGTSDGSTTYWDMRYNATMTWPPNPPKPIRDYQYFDRFAVTTNVPTRGTINSNSRYSNVLAQAYVNMAVEQFPGIQGVLSRAKMYCPPNLMTTNRAWTMTPQVTTWDSAQKIALKQILDRDVVLALPYAGVDSTTTDQYMNWGNRVDSNRMKWAQKWGTMCGGQPSSLYWGSEFPHHVGSPFGGQDTDVDWRNQPDYRTLDVRSALGISGPDLSETLQEEYYQYDGNLVGQWFGLMNPRQNLFTILVAAQSIIPKPAGTTITAADVMSERRAVLVVWRDPWPTAEDSRKYDETVPKADRMHRSFVRFFKWLDE